MKNIGDRMKDFYEQRDRRYLTRRTPVIVRVDGKAFHTFTKGFEKPFDNNLTLSMIYATLKVAFQIQGFKLAYTQSDEASFLFTDYDTLETSAWFDYCQNKIESITASMMSVHFNSYINDYLINTNRSDRKAFFDARAFNIPPSDVVNYFLWRAKDWERNSLNMYCQSFFSHRQLHEKSKQDKHEMLSWIGKNWANDLSFREKNGTFVTKELNVRDNVEPNYKQIESLIGFGF